jgi:protein SCO1/2
MSIHASPPGAARPFWKSPWFIGAMFGVLFLTGLRACQSRKLAPLPELGRLPKFALTDQRAQPFGSADLENRVALVSFFFTSCQTTCPAIIEAQRKVSDNVAKSPLASRVRMVSISVDPEYDTPAVLTAYAEKMRLDLGRWTLLTGARADIEALVVGGLRTAMGTREEVSPGLIDIAHSMKLVLVDRNGIIRHYFSAQTANDLELAAAYALEYAAEESAR